MKKALKKNIIIILMLVFSGILIFPSLNVRAEKNNDEGYEVKTSYGIDGKYRAMKYIPIDVELKALEKDFKGEVEVRVASNQQGSYDAYSVEATVVKGETVKVTIPVKISENSNKFTVNLIEDGKSIFEKKSLISSGRVTESELFTGILSDDVTSLGYLGDVKFELYKGSQEGKLQTIKLNPDIIGNNELNIDGLNLIFINNFNMGNLKKEHYDSLNAWVNKGGILIIGAGVNESKTINSIDNVFLNIKSNKLNETNVTLGDENLKLILSNLTIPDSKILLGEEGKELVYSVKRGNGEILVSRFDLGTEPLISSKEASKIWISILNVMSEKLNQGIYGGSKYNNSYQAQSLINNIPVDKVVSPYLIGIILVSYVFIIGVVLYFVLKKINRRDLIWSVLPIIAIFFSIVLYMAGSSTRFKDLILNQVNIVSIDKDGRGLINGYLGVGTKYKDDVNIEKPKNIDMNYIVDMNYYGGMPQEEVPNKLRVKTTYKDNNSYYAFNDSSALELKNFEVLGKEEIIPKIESELNLVTGNLNGIVKNNLDNKINKLLLIIGSNVWDLGTVDKGAEIKVQESVVRSNAGLMQYGNELMQEYFNARNNKDDIKQEKYRHIDRYNYLFNMLSLQNEIVKKAKFIAVTDIPIDYGIDFGNKSISKYDTTVVIQDTEVDFTDKDGNINFPAGFFSGEIEKMDSNISIDPYSNMLYGQGEAILTYIIDKKVKISNIGIVTGTDLYGNKGGGQGTFYVYNYSLNDYEKVLLEESKALELNNVDNYLKDNKIKIKVILDTNGKGASNIPKITIKGRES